MDLNREDFSYYNRQERGQFGSFHATMLYCPKCKEATPVRSRLLLVLPDGELHEYLCQYCGTSVGTKTVKEEQNIKLLVK